MRKQFRAPWDILLIVITAGTCILLISLGYFTDGLIPKLIGWTIILGSAAFGVYGYSIQDDELRILRLGWSKDLKFSNIKKVAFKPDVMLGSFRKWGIGGLFSYLGYFSNRVLGTYRAYATHRKKTVVITTVSDDLIVISPDNPEEFVDVLKDSMAN